MTWTVIQRGCRVALAFASFILPLLLVACGQGSGGGGEGPSY